MLSIPPRRCGTHVIVNSARVCTTAKRISSKFSSCITFVIFTSVIIDFPIFATHTRRVLYLSRRSSHQDANVQILEIVVWRQLAKKNKKKILILGGKRRSRVPLCLRVDCFIFQQILIQLSSNALAAMIKVWDVKMIILKNSEWYHLPSVITELNVTTKTWRIIAKKRSENLKWTINNVKIINCRTKPNVSPKFIDRHCVIEMIKSYVKLELPREVRFVKCRGAGTFYLLASATRHKRDSTTVIKGVSLPGVAQKKGKSHTRVT